MGKTFITGDTHGSRDFHKLNSKHWPEGAKLTKEDVVIICGDWGAIFWPPTSTWAKSDLWLRKWYESKPWTTVVVPGNHENYDEIFKLPEIEMFGGMVRQVSDSVVILKRGKIYTINGKTFWTMGGGLSIDKSSRIVGQSWWAQEHPSYIELNEGMDILNERKGDIDYVITHVAPQDALSNIIGICYQRDPKYYDPLSEYLQTVTDSYLGDYTQWFCGHYHIDHDVTDKKLKVLYDRIIQI